MMNIKETKYPGYFVTEDGRVFKEVPQHETNGYLAVNVRDGERYRLERVHRLVAEVYIGDSEGRIVNHIDGNKKHNHASNLEYTSYAENNKHARNTGLNNHHGEAHHWSKLTEDQVRMILHRYRVEGIPAQQVAEEFGLRNRETVYAIANGRRWKHLKDEGSETIPKGSREQ